MIQVTNLTKEFKTYNVNKGFWGAIAGAFSRNASFTNAIDNISFSIRKGEFVGYVGENGAGKSTTIKILTGILVPTSGEAFVNNIIPYKNRRQNALNIGVVFGQRTQLWWDLAVRESFDLLKSIYKIPSDQFKKNMEHFHDILSINKYLDVPVRKLSLGQRMRCDLAASLLHEPEVLFLDEPTIGLDVVTCPQLMFHMVC
jgi:ABC-2 type transport system ATP-binding protein|tara:strand:+ start:157 stop:756 length:600 start_codon:yes stop_codon:yes gene_type:complete